MPRKELGSHEGERMTFQALFVRYGTKTDYMGNPTRTILVQEVRVGDRVVADHLWFNLTKGFAGLGDLQSGDVLEFDARVREYRKGYWGWNERKAAEAPPPEWDWKLGYPTRIKLVQRAEQQQGDSDDRHCP